MKQWIHSKKVVGIFLLLSTFCVIWSIYGEIVISPNQYMLAEKGEAMRSYYVMDANLNNDSRITEVQGLNYPFGEHIVYTDGQPMTAWIGKGIATIAPSLKENSVGYLNALSLYSLVLSALLIYLLLLEFKVSPLLAAVFSLGIILLGPQIIRMKWQPALAMSCYVPLSFYLLVRWWKTPNKNRSTFLFLNMCFWFFIHPYLGLMLSVFFLVSLIVRNRILRQGIGKYDFLHLSMYSFIPPLLFWTFMRLTDSHADRAASPAGLIKFSAHLECIFTSIYTPFADIYSSLFSIENTERTQLMESWAYIGLAAAIFTLIYLFLSAKSKWFSNTQESKKLLPNDARALVITSIILVIFALALPFKWFPNLKNWIDFFPPLKQFRSLSRFTWFYVFAINIALVIYLNQRIQAASKYRSLLQITSFLIAGSIIWEGTHLQAFAASKATTPNRFLYSSFDSSILTEINRYNQKKPHQAIVPVPYFHIGSHAFEVTSFPGYQYISDVMDLGHQLKLPITGSFYSRNSLPESILSFRFFSDDVFSKDIQSRFTSEPFIIYHDKRQQLSKQEKRILLRSDTIIENDTLLVASFDHQTHLTSTKEEYRSSLIEYRSSYRKKDNRFCNFGAWFDMEPNTSTNFFQHSNTYVSEFENPFYTQSKSRIRGVSGESIVSFWLKHNGKRANSIVTARYQDRDTLNNWSEIEFPHALNSYNIIDDWILCEFPLQLDSSKHVTLYFKTLPNEESSQLEISHISIRSKNSSIFDSISPSQWVWNNRPFEL